MYDRFAAQGVLYPRSGNSLEKLGRFYDAIEERKFTSDIHRVQRIIKESPFKNLHGTRVIEKFLMLIGMDDERRDISMKTSANFCGALPIGVRRKLMALAWDIAEECGPDLLRLPNDRIG